MRHGSSRRGVDLVAQRRSISKHNGGLGCVTEKPCAKSGENARSQNEPTHRADHSRILKSVPSTVAHNRLLITATFLCQLIPALVLVTTRLLSAVIASAKARRSDSIPQRCRKPLTAARRFCIHSLCLPC